MWEVVVASMLSGKVNLKRAGDLVVDVVGQDLHGEVEIVRDGRKCWVDGWMKRRQGRNIC